MNSHLRVSRPTGSELIQFKCTKYFRDDLTLVFEDAQCFNSIRCPLQCQINMYLVFHISQDGSEITVIRS